MELGRCEEVSGGEGVSGVGEVRGWVELGR